MNNLYLCTIKPILIMQTVQCLLAFREAQIHFIVYFVHLGRLGADWHHHRTRQTTIRSVLEKAAKTEWSIS